MPSKILSTKIEINTKKIIHHDKFDFIPEMQGWFNIHHAINAMEQINKLKKKNHMIISKDNKKSLHRSHL